MPGELIVVPHAEITPAIGAGGPAGGCGPGIGIRVELLEPVPTLQAETKSKQEKGTASKIEETIFLTDAPPWSRVSEEQCPSRPCKPEIRRTL